MKLKDLFNVTVNKKTHQESWHLRLKNIQREGFTSKELLEMSIPRPRIKKFMEIRK